MTTLRVETRTMLASDLGPDDPLPDLRGLALSKASGHFDPAKLTGQQKYSHDAHIRGCLPYCLQGGFDRSEVERPFRVAVLENEHLRAEWLLELGGRLWSLVDKHTGCELLYQPAVLHFVNIGLCNSWFAGGVEWNVSVRGHAAYTCSPVFAAAVHNGGDAPVLRIYEWDRFRELLWQIDFLLPDGSAALLARPRVINTRPAETPMYWWSNIALPEAPGRRVVVPADHAYQHDYDRTIHRRPVPVQKGLDVSYPTNNPSAHDFFYDVPEGNRPWIACVDGDGRGLLHASTSRLLGRKLFVWGMGRGGRHWQRQLDGRDGGYVEVQAGLARTQADYIPMPPRAQWAWMEAYMPVAAEPAVVHGADWPAAWGHVQELLDEALPQERLERMLAETAELADRPPAEVLFHGSDWPALEQRRRRLDGAAGVVPASMAFGEPPADGSFAAWAALLESGDMPHRPADRPPGAWVTHPAWRKRLAAALADGRGDHWLAWLHLGLMAWRADDLDAAEQAWRTSLAREPSAWACRNLAVLLGRKQCRDEAAQLYMKAVEMKGHLAALQVECGRALVDAGRLDDFDAWLGRVDEPIRRRGRVQFLIARAACDRDDLDTAEEVLDHLEIHDVREGDTRLTDLWFEVQAKRIAAAEGVAVDEALMDRVRQTLRPPKHLDYRMH